MCVLKIYSETYSFKTFSEKTNIPVYSVYDKGEYRNKKKTKMSKENSLSLDVSEKEWDDFPGQVTDALEFLSKYYEELSDLFGEIDNVDAYLDFPIYSRMNEEIANQNDHLPRDLVSIAGKLNLGIEMSQYSHDAFDGVSIQKMEP
ncbi:MAG: hypothetical protein COA42_18780 [Alteromonadaceae bacterium]|nr:MAG: hypothetical protein COA42_18780 [Alteromonadaceae bacterium]